MCELRHHRCCVLFLFFDGDAQSLKPRISHLFIMPPNGCGYHGSSGSIVFRSPLIKHSYAGHLLLKGRAG